MNKMISAFGAATIAVVVGMTTFNTATAAPIAPAHIQVTSDVEMARHRDEYRPRWKQRHHNWHERAERRHERRGYWNGYRGYREYRRGYRRHSDGYYYSPEVFQLFFRF
jgi:hypothetical protein